MSVRRGQTANEEDDIFHSVVMSEETSWQRGCDEGVAEGRIRGYKEGYALGTQKGTEIGTEVGFYAGYAEYVMRKTKDGDSKSRVIKVCEAIRKLADTFKDLEPTDETLTDNLSKLKGKFKQLLSLLGVQVEYNTVIGDKVKGTSF